MKLTSISEGGKIILIKTGAQSISNFWMNLLLLPLDVGDSIEKLMNAYLWGNSQYHGGIRWLAWDKLCEVKEE